MELKATTFNLDDRIYPNLSITWADKKRLCQFEAIEARQNGFKVSDNPYEENSFSFLWWADFFNAAANSESPHTITSGLLSHSGNLGL